MVETFSPLNVEIPLQGRRASNSFSETRACLKQQAVRDLHVQPILFTERQPASQNTGGAPNTRIILDELVSASCKAAGHRGWRRASLFRKLNSFARDCGWGAGLLRAMPKPSLLTAQPLNITIPTQQPRKSRPASQNMLPFLNWDLNRLSQSLWCCSAVCVQSGTLSSHTPFTEPHFLDVIQHLKLEPTPVFVLIGTFSPLSEPNPWSSTCSTAGSQIPPHGATKLLAPNTSNLYVY